VVTVRGDRLGANAQDAIFWPVVVQIETVAHEVSKRVLLAIVDAFPEPETDVITGIEITQGCGGDVRVDIRHISQQRADTSDEPRQLSSLRSAVSDALQPWRHTVRTIELVL
jgi:hypothetical protein